MKRDSALQPLSHQHHNALTGCLLIKKGVQKKADKKILKDFVQRLYKDDLLQHLDAEEKFVFPMLDRIDAHYRSIAQADHERIRVLGERVNVHEDGYALYSAIANLVEQHIRFEERVIFNKMQENLSDAELQQLSGSLQGLQVRKCSDYPVKFWE